MRLRDRLPDSLRRAVFGVDQDENAMCMNGCGRLVPGGRGVRTAAGQVFCSEQCSAASFEQRV